MAMKRWFTIPVALVLLVFPVMTRSTATAAGGFTNFQLGDGPTYGAPGEVCPNPNSHPFQSTPPCTNTQGEPQIRSDNSGTFYGVSENGIGGGTEAYRSTDNAQHYLHLLSPNETSTLTAATTPGGISPAGGDTDIATAPDRNTAGNFNVYAASLELANVAVSTSTNRGTSWTINPKAATVAGDDREWIAADLAQKVCISYRDLGAVGLHVDCSYDAGASFLQNGQAIDAAHLYSRTNFSIGNLQIDPTSHIIYQTYSSIDQTDFFGIPNVACNNLVGQPCANHVVYMAVSIDGGKTFTDHVVYNNPDRTVDYGHQFVNVSVDRRGNVYSVYSDNHNVYYSYSTDHGVTWTGPFQISTGTGNQKTAIMPWSVAGTNGRVDVVYYGADYSKPGVAPDQYPCNDSAHCQPGPDPVDTTTTAHWNVFFAENLSATTNGNAWNRKVQVTDFPVHYGGVCEGGVSCTGDRGHNRDLYDDFGIAVSPTTNAASIFYDSDRYSEYNHMSRCTADQDNTGSCTHTNNATGQSQIFANAPGGGGGGGTGGGGGGTGGGGNGDECHRDAQSQKAEQDLMTSINAHRITAGLPALQMKDTTQSDEARDHACDNEEQAKNSDRDSEGNTHTERMRGAGLTFASSNENNASVVQTTPGTAGALLDKQLMSNPTASVNILNPGITQVGIGAVDVNGTIWAVEDFSG